MCASYFILSKTEVVTFCEMGMVISNLFTATPETPTVCNQLLTIQTLGMSEVKPLLSLLLLLLLLSSFLSV